MRVTNVGLCVNFMIAIVLKITGVNRADKLFQHVTLITQE